MSTHPAAQPRGFLSALVAQVSSYLLEPIEETVEHAEPQLTPHPSVAVVAAAPRCGASTVARMLAAELASRADGTAIVGGSVALPRRGAPGTRAAARVAGAIRGLAPAAGAVQARGRLAFIANGDARSLVAGVRYLAPVVLDLPADGSAAGAARACDRVVVVASPAQEPPLADAVAYVLGGEPIKVLNRAGDPGPWQGRADVVIPDARITARAAVVGARPLGALGAAIAELADRLETAGSASGACLADLETA